LRGSGTEEGAVGAIHSVDSNDLPWTEYAPAADGGGPSPIRVKALSGGRGDVPSMQYLEYAPGHADPVHRHATGEVFVVTDGELWLDDVRHGPGAVAYVPADTDYAVRAGGDGVRYFRIVVA
jgi:quercetin dioxygenase-like cupin family protein